MRRLTNSTPTSPKTRGDWLNQRIEELLENPTGNPDREYDAQYDQHTIPIGDDKGFIVYAVVESARLVIPLRLTPGLD